MHGILYSLIFNQYVADLFNFIIQWSQISPLSGQKILTTE